MNDHSRRRLAYWLSAIVYLGPLVGVPFIHSAEPYVLSLPFLLFWMVLWIFLGVIGLRVADALRPAADKED